MREVISSPVCFVETGFDQQHPALVGGDGVVANARGDGEKVALVQFGHPIIEPDLESASDHQEEFVLIGMRVPDELALQLGDLEKLIIDPPDDLWRPEVASPR